MKLTKIRSDESGAAALEFALLAPVFILLVFGLIAFGLVLWTQVGLQHGAEMAARCASVNTTVCPAANATAITNYAMQQALGLSLPSSTFTYSTPACGNQINASYTFAFPDVLSLPPVTLTAQACFPA